MTLKRHLAELSQCWSMGKQLADNSIADRGLLITVVAVPLTLVLALLSIPVVVWGRIWRGIW